MAHRFDATLKDLVQNYPRDWLALLDAPPTEPVSVVTPDLSTLTAFADVVLRVGQCLFHIDFQSGPDADLPRRILLYNVLLHERYNLPVHSVVVLLRPRADRGDLTGEVTYRARSERSQLDFRFEVMRLWQVPVEQLLAAQVGILPLAPLGRLEGSSVEAALPGVIEQLVDLLDRKASPAAVPELLTAAFVLTGMRVSQQEAIRLFQGVRAMRESTAYQAILDEGRVEGRVAGQVEEAIKFLLRQGQRKFGAPSAEIESTLRSLKDLERLERMGEEILTAQSWQELLAIP
jgi:predicted transposase YdaD